MPKRILVLDDDPHLCMAMKLVLGGEGFEVETVQTWSECVDKLKENPDLILLDILMPSMNGIAALRTIKELNPKAKVMMVSVISQKFFVQQCKELGAADFVTKPFDNRNLIHRVKQVVGG